MRRLPALMVLCLVGCLAASSPAIADPPTPPAAPAITHAALGVSHANGITVDPNTGNVYIPVYDSNEVLVRDAAGNAVTTVSIASPESVAVDPSTGQVWVAGGTTITSFDPTTFTVGTSYPIPTSTAGCPTNPDPVNGYVWFAFYCATGSGRGIAVLNPGDGSVIATRLGLQSTPLVTQVPSEPILYAADYSGTVYELDTSDPAEGAAVVTSRSNVCSALTSMAWSAADGDLVVACSGTVDALWLAPDLTTATGHAIPGQPEAVTANGTGGYVAVNTSNGSTHPDLYVYPAGSTAPVEELASYDSSYPQPETDRLAVSSDGSRLYVLHASNSFSEELTVVTNPATPAGQITLSAPPHANAGAVAFTGTLGMSDGAAAGGITLAVTRTNPDSSQTVLADVTTESDGTFSVSDNSTAAGSTTYTVGYAGDSTHAVASTSAVIDVEPRAPTVSLALPKTAIAYGSSITLTATLAGHGSNSTVTLFGNGAQLASEAVDGSGHAAFTVKPTVNTTYHVAFSGDEMYTSGVSANHTVDVSFAIHESMPGSYGVKSGYHLYHFHTACGKAAHDGCPKLAVVIAPRPAAEIDLQFEEYLGGKWRLLLDRGLKTAPNGSCSLTVFYTNTKVENIPMRAWVDVIAATRTNTAGHATWEYFKVTR